MTEGELIDTLRQAVLLLVVLATPVLLVGLLTGLVAAVLQTATQVQEQTLSFVPKIIAMLLTLVLVGPWMISRLVEFGRAMFASP